MNYRLALLATFCLLQSDLQPQAAVPTADPVLQEPGAQQPVFAPNHAATKQLEDMLRSGSFTPIQFVHLRQQQEQPLPEQAFYNAYLAPYYPRACVIGGVYFSQLPADDLDKTLADVVRMFKDEPWFYFVSKPENFNHAAYWELATDQLAIVHEFMVRLRVDQTTKKTFNPAQGTPATAGKNAPYLLDYLLENGTGAAADSMALSYDYENRLFIDAIKREDLKDAMKYLGELEYLQENLRNTKYERDYHEHMTYVVRSLFELLKKRQNVSDEELDAMRNKKKNGKFSQYGK